MTIVYRHIELSSLLNIEYMTLRYRIKNKYKNKYKYI